MKTKILMLGWILSAVGVCASAQAPAPEVESAATVPAAKDRPVELSLQRARSVKFDLRNLPQTRPVKFERPEHEEPDSNPVELPGGPHAGPEGPVGVPGPSAPAPAPVLNFDGLDFATWGAGHPPDTNGDVGPTYFIQTINTSIGVFRKSDQVRVAAFTFNTFMSQGQFGNLCDTNNFGDPVVLYDTFEDRWIITDFAFQIDGSGNVVNPPGTFQCFAVSKTGDPVSGGWNFYSVSIAGGLGDYPKFGVWTDGIYMSANVFGYPAGASFQNARVFAYNKQQMYAGSSSVQVVTFNAPAADFTLLPSNARLQTGTPPPGTPAYFVSTWEFLNALTVYKFHVDWNRISASTFTGPDTPLAATSWPNATAPSAPSSGGNNLDVLATRAMMQNQYTNLGGVESLWAAHTVRRANTTGFAASRWYQVDVTGGTVAANLPQATTFDPDGANVIYRFVPSLALDRAGDLALGYTTSNSTTKPALKYAGRLASDPINTFSQTEQLLIQGTGTQTGNCGGSACIRWGDYSAMTLDPDGCTFWYTGEYYAVDGLNHQTRIGTFSYPSCTPVGAGGTLSGTVTRQSDSSPLAGAVVTLGSRTATTDGSGFYSFSVPAGTYPSIGASFPGCVAANVAGPVVTDGNTTTQNFSLAGQAASACLTDTTQADFQTGVGTNIDFNASPGDALLSNPTILNQQNTTLGTSGVGITTTTYGGQTFTPSISGQLVGADINLFCSGCTGTTPNLTLSVRATSGGLPTGADLASATITGFGNGGVASYFSVTFASPLAVTAGTQYALVIRPTVNPSPGTYALTRSGTSTAGSDVYAGGTRVAGATSGTVWSIPLTGGVSTDAGFRVYINNGYSTSGELISGAKDANPQALANVTWTTLSWDASTPASTGLKFQVAGSNSATGPFNFVGPDTTAATFFTTSGASLSQFNGLRYVKYRALLSTTDTTQTPALNDVTMCYVDILPADASITVDDGQTTATAGGSTTYTITASNAGPGDASGGTVADTFPASLTCSWTCVGAGGGTCTASGSGNINDTIGLPSGASVTYTASCTIPSNATGTLSDTATVSLPGSVNDPVPGNNSSTDSDTLVAQADLAVTDTDGVTTATPGGSVTYTITASNAGPSDDPAATVADTFPASETCTWTCVGAGGGTCTASGSGNLNDTVQLPSGGSVTYTASCTISAAATGSLADTATVTTSVTDPTPGNNSATDVDALMPASDLAITDTDGVTAATPGGSVTYTITASNAGPSDDPAATVADTFPASETCTWTCVGAGGGTCTASGSGNINDTAQLPSGSSVTYTASCTIAAAATGTLADTATVTASGTDPNPGNNSATDVDSLMPASDLAVSVTDGVTSAVPGGSVTYTITASNAGPSNASGSSVSDTFPASLSCNWTCGGAGGGTCTASGSGNIGDTVDLPSGGRVTYIAACTIASGASGTLSDTAVVATGGSSVDPTPGNNSATDSDTLTPHADVAVTLYSDHRTYVQMNDTLDYVIFVNNTAGPSDANVTVQDVLPAWLSGGVWNCVAATGITCNNGVGDTLSDTVTLPVGGFVAYVFSAGVIGSDAGEKITNSVSVSLNGATDPTPANNSASDTDTLVIFRDDFETPKNLKGIDAAPDGMSVADLRIDDGLLAGLGIAPVAVASGTNANGKVLFSIELARFGKDVVARLLLARDGAPAALTPWQALDTAPPLITLAWQAATPSGYLSLHGSGASVEVVPHKDADRLTGLTISLQSDTPWLTLIAP